MYIPRGAVPAITLITFLGVLPRLLLRAEDPAPQSGPEAGRTALERLEEAASAEPGLSAEFKEALQGFLQEMEAERAARDAEAEKEAEEEKGREAVDEVLGRLRVYGDFRLRAESNFGVDGVDDQNRARVRLRLGATYAVLPSLSVGARLTTGSREDPKSPHQTLGQEFDRFEINLDRAYLAFHPEEAVPGLELTAGKFAQPLVSYSIYSELVWDADVQPTGAASQLELTKLVTAPAWLASARLDFGGYVVSEYAATDDAYSLATQAALEVIPAEGWKVQTAVGYTYYTDLTPEGQGRAFAQNLGNAIVDTNGDGTPDDFLSRFSIIEPSLALTCSRLPLPVTVSGEYIHNFGAATSSIDSGYALGVAIGNLSKPGDFRVYYQWQALEQDAVLSLVSQDDFRRTTNFRGHVFGARYQLARSVALHAWFLLCQPEDPAPGEDDGTEWRFRFDIDVRF